MTPQEILANFGGRPRLARMRQLFEELTKMGCELFIVSIGFRDTCILPHLQAVGLEQFFKPENVFGQDSRALQERGFVKGRPLPRLPASVVGPWSSRQRHPHSSNPEHAPLRAETDSEANWASGAKEFGAPETYGVRSNDTEIEPCASFRLRCPQTL
ncbi:unnamed protein product [Symbiodinium natans]|uniref:Uncharacterized protein n=1 Tax=Symbiodinium natans TaxID=878477 RepID=A0A812THS9_9DINO|nr:unnamed protein product [Symbiodinium natans]